MIRLFRGLVVLTGMLGILGLAGMPSGFAGTFLVTAIVVGLIGAVLFAARGASTRRAWRQGALLALAVLGNAALFLSVMAYLLLVGALVVSMALAWVQAARATEPEHIFETN